jgi:hypothetical protein
MDTRISTLKSWINATLDALDAHLPAIDSACSKYGSVLLIFTEAVDGDGITAEIICEPNIIETSLLVPYEGLESAVHIVGVEYKHAASLLVGSLFYFLGIGFCEEEEEWLAHVEYFEFDQARGKNHVDES